MKQRVLVTDFDGVLGDSLQIALALTRSIVQLFGDGREVSSFADYYKYFGRQSEDKIVTTEESQTLRELHRILIRYHFSEISLFHRVAEIYYRLRNKPTIVSSSYADAIEKVLGDFSNSFEFIYGYESGHKKEILIKLAEKYDFIYVTDTLRDIEICTALNVPVIAVTWGYDPMEKLVLGNPTYLISDYRDFEKLLGKLNFI